MEFFLNFGKAKTILLKMNLFLIKKKISELPPLSLFCIT